MKRVLLAAVVGAVVCGNAGGALQSHPGCPVKSLSVTFTKIPGSASGGLVGYRLSVTNRGSVVCLVSGLPRLTLLDAEGSSLPTAAGPLTLSAFGARVVLRPGRTASLTARFSPDYRGPQDAPSGPCQPAATRLRVAPGFDSTGRSLTIPVEPPTPVCNRGSIQLTAWKA